MTWLPLALVGGVLEALLLFGIALPMRLDHHLPSLQTNLAVRLGTDARGLLLYSLLAGGLAFCASAAALLAGRGPRHGTVVAVTFTVIFSLTLLPAHPTYSSDIFHYVATARVDFAHGANPHRTPPEAFPEDPLMPLSGWKWLPSPYGPAWSWLSAVPYAFSGGATDPTRAVLAFKALAALCVVGTTVGVAVAAERLRPGSATLAAVLFGWSPIVLIHLGADGHNDAAMLLCLAWGIVALTRAHRSTAVALFGLAVLVKPAAVLALVLLGGVMLRRGHIRALMAGVVACGAVTLLLFWPYWEGPQTLRSILDEGRYFSGTPASLLQRLLEPSLGGDPARVVVGGIMRLLLLVLLMVTVVGVADRPQAIVAATGAVYTITVVLLGTWYQPWYATWALLFLTIVAPLKRSWMLIIAGLTGGALLSPVAVNYMTALSGRSARDAPIDALTVAFVVLPLLAVLPLLNPQLRVRIRRAEALGTTGRSG